MTKDQFIDGYCERSGIAREWFDAQLVALPCACDYEGCQGWATIRNDPDQIRHHMEFFAPPAADDADGGGREG